MQNTNILAMEKLSNPELYLNKQFVKERRLKILANILFIIGAIVAIEVVIIALGEFIIEHRHPEYGLFAASIGVALFLEVLFYATYLVIHTIAETSINVKQLKNNE